MADDKEVVEKTISEDLVVTKYKLAGEIVNSEYGFTIVRIKCRENSFVVYSLWWGRPHQPRTHTDRKHTTTPYHIIITFLSPSYR